MDSQMPIQVAAEAITDRLIAQAIEIVVESKAIHEKTRTLSSKNRWLYTNWPSYSALGGLCCPRGWTLNAAALAFCERDFHGFSSKSARRIVKISCRLSIEVLSSNVRNFGLLDVSRSCCLVQGGTPLN